MKTWFDIEPLVDKIEELDKSTLEQFARVPIPPSQNPAFHQKFNHTRQRILRRLSQLEEKESQKSGNNRTDEHWYKKPIGVIFLGTCAGVLVFLIKYLLGF